MESRSSGKPLRVLVIGAGFFSRFHIDAWVRIPDVEVAGICDKEASRAHAYATEIGAPAGTDAERMIDETQPDFIDIVTRPDTHLELCRLAAARGIPAICQKPLAPDFETSRKIVKEMSAAGVPFMVHENWRWQPWYRETRRLLDEGILGDLFSIAFEVRPGDGWGEDAYLDRQPYFRDYERFFIFETGVHFLDTFRYLAGEVETVYARLSRRNPAIRGEDAAIVVCNMKSGSTGLIDANRYNESEATDPRFTFASMRLDASRGHLLLDREGRMGFQPLGGSLQTHDYPYSRKGANGDAVFALQTHFVECLRSGKPFESTGDDYMKTLQLVEACYASAQGNCIVTL